MTKILQVITRDCNGCGDKYSTVADGGEASPFCDICSGIETPALAYTPSDGAPMPKAQPLKVMVGDRVFVATEHRRGFGVVIGAMQQPDKRNRYLVLLKGVVDGEMPTPPVTQARDVNIVAWPHPAYLAQEGEV